MALHAQLHLELGIEAGGIDDASANRRANVLAAGTVASLAIDSGRKLTNENGLAAGRLVVRRNLRIAGMAEDALVRGEAAGLRMRGIEARTHAPATPLLRIPAERQLDEASARSAMEIGPRMGAGSHDVVDLQLLDVGLFTAEADLPA